MVNEKGEYKRLDAMQPIWPMSHTPSVPLKASQILPAKIVNQLDYEAFSRNEGVPFSDIGVFIVPRISSNKY